MREINREKHREKTKIYMNREEEGNENNLEREAYRWGYTEKKIGTGIEKNLEREVY